MHRTSNYGLILGLLLASLLVLTIGCSTDKAPTGPAAESSAQGLSFQYPPLTPQFLADGPAPGYRFIHMDIAANLDDRCDSVEAEGHCDQGHDRTVKIDHFVEFKVMRGQMTSDTTISIIAPSGCYPVADFYPHPYQFNGMVQIKWKVREMGFPRDFDYSTLVPWYYNDAGEYIPVEYEWRGNYHELVIYTNHFSRYIITQVVNG